MELTNTPEALPEDIQLIPVLPEQEAVLANLLELYIHDFSVFMDLELDENGRFGYKNLSLLWSETGLYPFFIRVNNHLAGFVFLRKGSQISGDKNVWDMMEFFIVRRYRRQGVGSKVAKQVWKQFPGKWEVRVTDRNQKAKAFWASAIGEFIDSRIQPVPFHKNGKDWFVFSFESRVDGK